MTGHRNPARQLGWMLAIGVGSGLTVAGLLTAGGLRAGLLFCVGVAVSLTLLVGLLRLTAVQPSRLETSGAPAPAQKRPYQDLYFLEHRLSAAAAERTRYERRLRPLFIRLITERLRQQHGVDAVRTPGKARDIVGEDLWELMTGAPAPTDAAPSRDQLAAIVARIEEL
jgi:hypothetical protein